MTNEPTEAAVTRAEIAGLSVLEIGEPSAPVELVFLHANGFHAALYVSLLAPLARGRRILAADMRGHGRTRLPADPATLESWDPMRDDVLGLLATLDRPVAFAGHSLGGAISALIAGAAPERVRALALIEPVIAAPPPVRGRPRPADDPEVVRTTALSKAVAGRRRAFASLEAAVEGYRGRGPFRTWPEESLRAYVEEGFAQAPEGVVLRCDPAWESAIYVALGSDPWGALERFRGPLVVRVGEHGSTLPPEAESWLKDVRPDVDFARIPGATHFLPIERPEIARAAIEAALSRS